MNKITFIAAFATTLIASAVAHAAPRFEPNHSVVILEARPAGPNQGVVILEGRTAEPNQGGMIIEGRPSASGLLSAGKRVNPFKDATVEPIVR